MHPPTNNENLPPSSRTSSTPSKMFSYSLPPTYTQSSPFSFQQQSTFYTPSKPSPLSSSPLRANRSPFAERHSENENPSYSFTMSSPPPAPSLFFGAQSPATRSVSATSAGKRVVKKNPLIHRDEKDGGRETRRKLFLKRVREDSEDKRWDKKGGDDELLRSIYVADHKRSIGRTLREDAAYDETPDDYEMNQQFNEQAATFQTTLSRPSLTRPISPTAEQQMADEVARQEEAELRAYLEMMEAENSQYQAQQSQQHQLQQSQPLQPSRQQNIAHVQQSASDDIDYDKMFEDLDMDGAQHTGIPDDEDMMDMS